MANKKSIPKEKKEVPKYAKYVCRDDNNEEYETANTLEQAREIAISMLDSEHQTSSIEIYKLLEINERAFSTKIVPFEDE